ncbi:uncharacterized, partial [Tachysurus ichikawai]
HGLCSGQLLIDEELTKGRRNKKERMYNVPFSSSSSANNRNAWRPAEVLVERENVRSSGSSDV